MFIKTMNQTRTNQSHKMQAGIIFFHVIHSLQKFLVFKKNEHTFWLNYILQSKKFLDFTTSVTAGTQHPRARWRDVKRYAFPMPKESNEKEQIQSIIASVDQSVFKSKEKVKTLELLKKALMQNLLTGKVRVDVEKINKLLAKDTELES